MFYNHLKELSIGKSEKIRNNNIKRMHPAYKIYVIHSHTSGRIWLP